MSDLDGILERIGQNISEHDSKREKALKDSRAIVRRSASLIMDCHRGLDEETLRSRWSHLHEQVKMLKEELASDPSLYFSGFVEHAQAEAAEAGVVVALRLHEGSAAEDIIPEPDFLHVRETAYLKGLGDAIGELRRFTLERLRTGDLEAATWYYERMDEIYAGLVGLGHSHVSSELRKKMDTGRVLLERTLGELVNVKHMASLEHEMKKSSN